MPIKLDSNDEEITSNKDSLLDIKSLEELYISSAKSLDEIFTNKSNFVEEEMVILNKIKSVESKTLPLVKEIIKLKSQKENTKALNLLLNEAAPLFTNWLAVINEFIDYQEAKIKWDERRI